MVARKPETPSSSSVREDEDKRERSPNGFFDRAVERWEELARRGGRRMSVRDAQLIAQGARERYMTGRYVDRTEEGESETERELESLPGPVAEGAYTFPIPSRPIASRAVGVSAPQRDAVVSPRTERVRDDRYSERPSWQHETSGRSWDTAAYDDWDKSAHGGSSADPAEQWSHDIPRDPSERAGRGRPDARGVRRK